MTKRHHLQGIKTSLSGRIAISLLIILLASALAMSVAIACTDTPSWYEEEGAIQRQAPTFNPAPTAPRNNVAIVRPTATATPAAPTAMPAATAAPPPTAAPIATATPLTDDGPVATVAPAQEVVIHTVVVEREVEVERIVEVEVPVVQTVVVEVEPEAVIQTVVVEREVEVRVIQTVVIEREVAVEIERVVTVLVVDGVVMGPDDDHSDASVDATRLTVGDTIGGNIETAGDADVFQFETRAGSRYTIRVSHGTNRDTVLNLFNHVGRDIASNDDSGGDGQPMLEWVAPSSGSYFLQVRGFDSDNLGTYRIELTETVDDHSDTINNATLIRVGDALNGDIEVRGDIDMFRFEARRGNRYRFRVQHGTNSDTVLVLRDSSGGGIASDDDSGDGNAPLLLWTAPSSGTYFFEVGGYDHSEVGTYRVELESVDANTAVPEIASTTEAPRNEEAEWLGSLRQ